MTSQQKTKTVDKNTKDRLQKYLANLGFGSRREIERWIADGKIRVNGLVSKLGDRVDSNDRIQVNGKPVGRTSLSGQGERVILYHKPEGELVTRKDPQGRPTVFDSLGRRAGAGRWINVGRLDMNTSGLLLLTTDGELANRLMHPSQGVEREYAVRVLGVVDDDVIHQLQTGVQLEDGPAHFDEILDSGGTGANHWYHVVLKEGRKREVRRLWEALGLKVSRLIRVRYGAVELGRGVKPGHWRDLKHAEFQALYKGADLKPPKQALMATKRKPGRASQRENVYQGRGKSARPSSRRH